MEKAKLGAYQLMVASQYFESINDFKHLELTTKKAKNNMEKFHFNPIPLTKETRHYFTHLETLFIYKKGDEEFRNEHFYKRIIHYDIDYEEYHEKKQENDEYLNVILDKETADNLHKVPPGVTCLGFECFHGDDDITEFVIPDSVTSIGIGSIQLLQHLTKVVLSTNLKRIDDYALIYLHSLKEIAIPDSVTSIGTEILEGCQKLTAMTIPTHWKLCGDRFFNNRPSFCSFECPFDLEMMNGQLIEQD